MKWTKITIQTIADAEDIIISTMYDLGLEGAQIEDKVPLTAWEKEQMFVDILPDCQEDDGVAYLNFFVEAAEQTDAQKEGISDAQKEGIIDAQQKGISDAQQEGIGDTQAGLAPGLSDGVDNSYFAVSSGKHVDVDALVEQIKQELDQLRMFMDIGEGTVTVSETEDKDWENNWKEYFHQFTIDDLLVTPSWEEVRAEDQDKKILHIDPGTAFGTGMHETTQLCIRALKKHITPETELLDVGTGSGILAIVALLYGIRHAVGTDLDPCASAAVEENKEMNGIAPDRFELLIGNIISDEEIREKVGSEKYDIVVANILAEVLVPLTPVVARTLRPGGIYITSGILNGKEELVEEAVRNAGMEVLEVTRQGEWMSVTARRKAADR